MEWEGEKLKLVHLHFVQSCRNQGQHHSESWEWFASGRLACQVQMGPHV